MLKLDVLSLKNNNKPNTLKQKNSCSKVESLNYKISSQIIKTDSKMLVEIIAIWLLKIKS